MGIPLLLGLLLSRTGGLLAVSLEQPNSCTAAENFCLADPVCNATYQTLQNCSQAFSKSSFFLLDQETRDRCLEAKRMVQNSYFQDCRCHRRTRKQEEQCLRVFWTVHSTFSRGVFNLEVSPYEDITNEETSKSNYDRLANKVTAFHLTEGSGNPCLDAANICQLDSKCIRLRSHYAQICSTKQTCDRRKCHRGLRHFFERVGVDFTKSLLFCPCQNEVCGERRWNTIVPECSFQSSTKPNCLLLQESCLKDNICRSRLADFQEQCKPSDTSPDGCSLHNHAACLEAYMGMIGTPMTPNYISNSSVEVTLWCSCKNSGNQKEECDQVLNSIANNRCLKNAIYSQMGLNQVNADDQDQMHFTPSLNIQGDGTSTVFTAKIYREPEVKNTKPEVLKQSKNLSLNSTHSAVQLSMLTLTLTLLVLLLGPL